MAGENPSRLAQLAPLFGDSPVGLAEISASGTLIDSSSNFCRTLDRTRDEIIGATIADLIDLDDAPATRRAIAEVLASGRSISLDVRFQRRDRSLVWANTTFTRLNPGDAAGGNVLVTAVDLTARRDPETQSRENDARSQRMIAIATVGIYFFRADGLITGANDAFLRMTGYSRGDLEAGLVRWDSLTPPEWLVATTDALEQLKRLGNSVPYEKEFVRRDGTRWWALLAASRLGPDDFIEYAIDVTYRRKAEVELRRARDSLDLNVQERTAELDAVAGALRDEIIEVQRGESARQELLRRLVTAQEEERQRISRELHDEIGQLVTALMLGIKALNGAGVAPETVENLHGIAECVGRAVHEMAVRLRPTALDDLGLLRTLKNVLEEWSQRARIEVDFHSQGCDEERFPPHIESTVYRIVQEALTNVIKHARARRVSLILERRAGQLIAIVEDDGSGFSPPVAQTAPSPQQLGLVGMRERAALVDGELKVESTPGGGTTIFLRIPLPTEAPRQS